MAKGVEEKSQAKKTGEPCAKVLFLHKIGSCFSILMANIVLGCFVSGGLDSQ
mgnify:CR=1 FL=1